MSETKRGWPNGVFDELFEYTSHSTNAVWSEILRKFRITSL